MTTADDDDEEEDDDEEDEEALLLLLVPTMPFPLPLPFPRNPSSWLRSKNDTSSGNSQRDLATRSMSGQSRAAVGTRDEDDDLLTAVAAAEAAAAAPPASFGDAVFFFFFIVETLPRADLWRGHAPNERGDGHGGERGARDARWGQRRGSGGGLGVVMVVVVVVVMREN